MSTATEKTKSDIDLYRLTASQFETIVDTGVFGDDKVELLGGHLVKLMTSDERHITTVDSVFRALLRLLPETSCTSETRSRSPSPSASGHCRISRFCGGRSKSTSRKAASRGRKTS